MRIALLSDVHGNLPAFEAVLADVDADGRRGDLVPRRPGRLRRRARRLRGSWPASAATSASPATTTSWSRASSTIADFSASAAAAARWTQETIGEDTIGVPERPRARRTRRASSALYHASPRDPVWEYVLSTWQADECMDLMDAARGRRRPLARGALVPPRRATGKVSGRHGGRPALERDLSERRVALNPGGVGQPRDGDPRAAWLLLDTETWKAELAPRGVPDRRGGERDRGGRACPQVLAERLYSGQ